MEQCCDDEHHQILYIWFQSLVHWQVCLQQQGSVWTTWGDYVSCGSASWKAGGLTTPGRASNTPLAGWRSTCTVLCSFWMRCCTLCHWQIQGLLTEDEDHVQISIWILWMCTHRHTHLNIFASGQICYLIDTHRKHKWPTTNYACNNQCTHHRHTHAHAHSNQNVCDKTDIKLLMSLGFF